MHLLRGCMTWCVPGILHPHYSSLKIDLERENNIKSDYHNLHRDTEVDENQEISTFTELLSAINLKDFTLYCKHRSLLFNKYSEFSTKKRLSQKTLNIISQFRDKINDMKQIFLTELEHVWNITWVGWLKFNRFRCTFSYTYIHLYVLFPNSFHKNIQFDGRRL